jgi:protein TonB
METPPYPPLARAADIEGDVSLMAQVGADGTVTAVDVLRAPHRLLADAARKAVLRYRYTPGTRNGVPAAFNVPVTVRFRLQ